MDSLTQEADGGAGEGRSPGWWGGGEWGVVWERQIGFAQVFVGAKRVRLEGQQVGSERHKMVAVVL